MADKQPPNTKRRGALLKQVPTLERWKQAILPEVNWKRALIGLGITLVVAGLIPGYEFQNIPEYQVGDIADRQIEALSDFTLVDQVATTSRRLEIQRTVPAVFRLDLRQNQRVEAELRTAFGEARRVLSEEGGPTPAQASSEATEAQSAEDIRERLITRLRKTLTRFDRGKVLEVLYRHSFSADLERQMVELLQSAMRHPGVAASRDVFMIYQDRGIVLLNNVTGQDEAVPWLSIRDLEQAKQTVRQNEYRLTAVSGEDKQELIEFLESWVIPNVNFDERETQSRENLALSEEPAVLIQIKKGRTVVRQGDEVTFQHLPILEEMRSQRQARQPTDRLAGILIISGFFLIALWHYLLSQTRARAANQFLVVSVVLILSLIVSKLLMGLAGALAESFQLDYLRDPLNFYFVIPFAFGSALITLLVGAPVAVLYSLLNSVFIALMGGEIQISVFSLVGCLLATYVLRQYRERNALVQAGLYIGLVNVIVAMALQLYHGGFAWDSFGVRSGGAFLGGIFVTPLAAMLLPVLERIFGITTDIRLLELSNLNNPILRRLAVEAPGTYHHSIIVGTLAEAAAEAIEANSLLARVGAYYHDIGKMRKPEYYVENQIYMANKHEGLSPTMSALILASHVKDGLAMGNEIGLPKAVKDLIPQHHGTKLMTFFFQKAKREQDEKQGEVEEKDFRYTGPKPDTREAAILMLADQVEAASRTLQDPTPRQIRGLIRRLIQSTIEDRQFDECDITTRDLDNITRAFERIITGMYHHRVEYPGFEFNKQVEEQPQNQHIQ